MSSGLSSAEIEKIIERDRAADVQRTGADTEIAPDELDEAMVVPTESMDDELELVSDDDLNELSEDELDEIAREVDDDPNAISMSDVAEINEDTMPQLGDEAGDESPAIGKVELKTVSVPPTPLTAPGANADSDSTFADYEPKNVEKKTANVDELFDRSDSVNLMGDHDEE